MKEFLKSMFSEGSDVSDMRVMAMIALFAGIAVAFYGMVKYPPEQLPNVTVLASMFVGVAFTGKVTQKFAETNNKTQTQLKVEEN